MTTVTSAAGFEAVWNSAIRSGGTTGNVVNIQRGSGTAIFFIHWGPGNIRFLRHVIVDNHYGHPVYGCEATGIRTRERPLLSIPDMAESYLRQIRMIQPTGPYFLVGLCTGSHIAYEMAHRLVSAGERIGLLAAVNGVCPGVRQLPPDWRISDIYDLRLATLARKFDVVDIDHDLPFLLDRLKQKYWIDERATLHDFKWHQVVYAANLWAQENYHPPSYDGDISVFNSASLFSTGDVPWDAVARNTETFVHEGDNSPAILQSKAFSAVLRESLRE